MGEFYFDDGAFSFSDGTFRLFFHMKEPGGLSNVPLPTFLIEKHEKHVILFKNCKLSKIEMGNLYYSDGKPKWSFQFTYLHSIPDRKHF